MRFLIAAIIETDNSAWYDIQAVIGMIIGALLGFGVWRASK